MYGSLLVSPQMWNFSIVISMIRVLFPLRTLTWRQRILFPAKERIIIEKMKVLKMEPITVPIELVLIILSFVSPKC